MTARGAWLGALVVLALVVAPLWRGGRDALFQGSDDQVEGVVGAMRPEYRAWAKPWWTPPSAEIESLLFGLQAALGAGALAYAVGYWKGRRSALAERGGRT